MAENHHSLLKVHCRMCGQKRVGPASKGVQIKNHPQLIRWLRFLHDIEVERESEEIYPTRACDGCIGRLRNVSLNHSGTQRKALENVFELATKLHTNGQDDELRKLSRQFPVADFWAHSSSGMCSICDDSQKDTFPSIDFTTHLIVDVQMDPLTIIKFARTAKKPAAAPASAPTKRESEVKIIDNNEAKKAKIEAKPAASNLSSGQAWLGFIEALGRNRRSRCDKVADLLKWSNADDPKVLSDLKNSGITYKVLSTRHTTPNVEFKSTLTKAKRLLSSFPASKRALMLFRAITDTVTDGKTELMTHVGIHINLDHSNLAFLKKKIAAKKAELQAKEQQVKIDTTKTKRQAALAAAAKDAKDEVIPLPATPRNSKLAVRDSKGSVPKLPSGITIMKVPKGSTSSAPPPSTTPSSPSSSSTSSRSEGRMLMDRPSLDHDPNETITINNAKVKRIIADIERKHLPANRQMKTDVIFDCLHLRTDSPSLLADHGIIYNPKLGKHHLRVLSGQRKVHKNAIVKATENLNKYEWAAVMAQLIFNLLHTEDTLTLRVAGLMVDPFHSSSPLSFRMGFMLKHLLISGDEPGLSRNLLTHILKSCDVDPQIPSNDKKIEDALVQLLYCDPKEAKSILAATKKPIKISLKAGSAFNKSYVNSSASKLNANRRKIVFKEEPDQEEYQQRPTRSRGRPSRAEVKVEEDADYVPGKRLTRKLPSSISVTSNSPSRGGLKRGVRGKYNKSAEQKAKEAARIAQLSKAQKERALRRKQAEALAARREAAKAAQASTAAYYQDPIEMDPLAVPIEPLEVATIKTEVIDDELPPNIIGGHDLVAVDPAAVAAAGDVSGLLIASVEGNVASLESPGHQSSSSLDIENNPIQADPFENMLEPAVELNENEMEISGTTEAGETDPILPDEQPEATVLQERSTPESEPKPMETEAEATRDPFENPETTENPLENNDGQGDPFENPDMPETETETSNPTEGQDDPFANPETQPETSDSNPLEEPALDSNPLDSEESNQPDENGNPLAAEEAESSNPFEEPAADVEHSENGTLNALMTDKIHDPLSNGVVTPQDSSEFSVPQNGQANDPFEAASTSTNFNHQEQDIVNQLLQTSTNGDSANSSSMLDEDANDFFDKLIG